MNQLIKTTQLTQMNQRVKTTQLTHVIETEFQPGLKSELGHAL